MVDVRDREALKAWFETQPRTVGVIVVARAALRFLPSVSRFYETPDWPTHRIRTELQAPLLRALSAVRYFKNKSAAIISASYFSDSEIYYAADDPTYNAQLAAYFAVNVAISSLDLEKSTNILAAEVTYSLVNIFNTIYFIAGIEGDVLFIEDCRLTSETNLINTLHKLRPIIDRRLWNAMSVPFDIAEDWHRLANNWGHRPPPSTTSTNDWWVWTEWYQAILDGTLDEARAKLYGTVPDKLWQQGIDVVNAHIAAKLLRKDRPKPKRNLPSAYHFPVGTDGRLVAVKTTDAPVLPYPTSDADHKEQLDAAHELTRRLLALVRSPDTNLVRAGAYQASLEEYAADLPPNIEGGSILLAETSIQVLRGYFKLDEAALPDAFKERLRGLLLHHQSLRVYYPSISRYYDNIRTGRLTAPLPLDAINTVERLVEENTPTLFDPSVGPALAPAPIVTPVPDAPPPVAAPESRLPADPVAEVDPAKARTYSIAGTWNALYKGLLEGEKLHKAVEGWSKAANKMGEIIQSVSDIWPFK